MSTDARVAALQKKLTQTPSARVLWRAGELRARALLPLLAALTPTGDRRYDYSLARALGRCAAADGESDDHRPDDATRAAVGARLRQLAAADDDAVRATAQAALLGAAAVAQTLIDDDAAAAAELRRALHRRLPDAVRALLDADGDDDGDDDGDGDPTALAAQLHEHPALVFDVYLLGLQSPKARAAALRFAADAAFAPGPFAALRRLFKTAELLLDGELYGLLTRRIETTPPYYHRHDYPSRYQYVAGLGAVDFANEMAKPAPALAYSQRTRDYLRRRAWRTLRRLGESGDDAYVDLAVGQLLAVDDTLARPRRRVERYVFDPHSPDYRRLGGTSVYGGLSALWTFNHILYRDSVRYRPSASGRGWEIRAADSADDPQPAQAAAFAPLWRRRPDALLQLLLHSRCAPVHRFAAAALAADADACATLTSATLTRLLASPYPVTATLALELARARLAAGHDVEALLDALLDASLAEARALALARLAADPAPLADGVRLARLLASPHADVRRGGRALIAELDLDAGRRDALIARLLAGLLAAHDDAATDDAAHDDAAHDGERAAFAARVADIDAALHALFPARLRGIGLALIEDLLDHRSAAVQTFAARLLAGHATPPERLPPALLQRLLDSDHAEVVSLGVTLLGRLPDATLRARQALLLLFCQNPHGTVRHAAGALVRRLSVDDAAFADAAAAALMPPLYRREPEEKPGLHEDLLTLLCAPALAPALARVDDATLLRLLDARSAAAQRLGAHLLARRDPLTLRVARWARLADHPQLAARRWAWQAYRDHPGRIRAAVADALRLLDSDWDDTRAFGFDYFAGAFTAADWTPALLAEVCDSAHADTRRFALDRAERRLADFPDDGEALLTRLSQHPGRRVQAFAAELLERHAAGRPALIAALQRYFVTVLSQVNRGRVARRRVQAFLHREALRDAASARVAVDVFTRQSATGVLADRAACLQALCAIRERHPQLATPLLAADAER